MDLEEVETTVGFHFRQRELLARALTHGSHLGESGLARSPQSDNEQLEFLGDAILGLIVSEHVVKSCPDFDEGHLSNVKHRLVNRMHLAEVARKLEIGKHLLLGRAEARSGGREKTSLLANAFEALLGAAYLDSGIEPVRQLVLRHVVGDANLRELGTMYLNNVKTTLESRARERNMARPEYNVRAENIGFPQSFVAEVRVGGALTATGRGSSKKKAEMEAAREMLERIDQERGAGCPATS